MPGHYQRGVYELTLVLENEPVPAKIYDVAKLEGLESGYRVRIGGIRVTYRVLWQTDQILILKVEWRGRAYKKS